MTLPHSFGKSRENYRAAINDGSTLWILDRELSFLPASILFKIPLHQHQQGTDNGCIVQRADDRQYIREEVQRIENVDQSEHNRGDRSIQCLTVFACPPVFNKRGQYFAIF